MNSPAHDTSKPLLQFRADIEGLRAVAIIIVVACHAGFAGFQGGFSGVDVFFVVSGFLITGLLVNEFDQTGSVRLLAFYARRLKRLLPALLLMTLAIVVAASVLLAPIEQLGQASTVMAVPLWITNFHFGFGNVDYFAAAADTNLFLHTWSLAVEEQFYLVWPVFILYLFGATRGTRQGLINGLAVVVAAGFLLSLFLSDAKPLWAFYLMPSRAWQFALGGLVFVLTSRVVDPGAGRPRLPANAHAIAGWAGLALVVAGVLLLTETMTYPGYGALLPSVGTALLLFAGTATSPPAVTRLLALPPMQMIGKVSYSWYLWHWPVLVLGNTVLPGGGLLQNLALVGAALLLAFISLYTVEGSIRHSRTLNRRPRLTVSLALTLMASAFGLSLYWQQKAGEWATSPEQAVLLEVRDDLPMIYPMGCDEWYTTPRVQACSFGNRQSDRTAVLFGDSVGAQWFTALATPLIAEDWHFVVVTKSACPIVDEPIFYARIGMEYTVCSDWRKAAVGFIAGLQPEIVFMGSSATYEYSATQWLEGTTRVLDALAPATGRLFIIQGNYRLPFDGPQCLARRDWQPAALQGLSACSATGPDGTDAMVAGVLQQAVAAYPNVGVLDLNPVICPDAHCAARIGDQIVFRDNQHIADGYVEAVTTEVTRAMDGVRFGDASL